MISEDYRSFLFSIIQMQSCKVMHRRYHQQLEQQLEPNYNPSEQIPYVAMGIMHKRF